MLPYILFCITYNVGQFSSYDLNRIVQIFLPFLILITLFKKIKFSKVTLFFFTAILFTLLFQFSTYDIFQLQDLLMWLMVFLSFIFLKSVYKESNYILYFIWLLGALSTLSCFFIFLSIFNLLIHNQWFDWQLNGGSLRVYDSVLVCNFWLLTYVYSKKDLVINKFYYFLVFFIFLGIFFDGARSAFLSISLPLVVLLFYRDYRNQLLKTALMGCCAFLLYKTTSFVHAFYWESTQKLIEINRFSSSGRIEMWTFMFQEWSKQPLSGLGGGYLAKIDYPIAHHAHNVVLRLIFEWGWLGSLVLLWLLIKLKTFFCSNTHIVLKIGVIGLLIDGLLSGMFIYPVTQMMSVLFLAVALSDQQQIYTTNWRTKYSKALLIGFIGLYTFLIYQYFYIDLVCLDCSSQTGTSWPYFWQYGSSEHLTQNHLNQ